MFPADIRAYSLDISSSVLAVTIRLINGPPQSRSVALGQRTVGGKKFETTLAFSANLVVRSNRLNKPHYRHIIIISYKIP